MNSPFSSSQQLWKATQVGIPLPWSCQDTEAQGDEQTLRPDITIWGKQPGNYWGVSHISWLEPKPSDNAVSFYEVNKYPPAFVSPGISLLYLADLKFICAASGVFMSFNFEGLKLSWLSNIQDRRTLTNVISTLCPLPFITSQTIEKWVCLAGVL